MLTVVYAHPYGRHSRINQYLLNAVQHMPGTELRDLYQLYADFYIDHLFEQRLLQSSELIVLQYPMQWHFPPPLLLQYLEKVFSYGWAWGEDAQGQPAQQLAGKTLWLVVSGVTIDTDKPEADCAQLGLLPLQQLAQRCGMQWAKPMVVPHKQLLSEDDLPPLASQYRQQLEQLLNSARKQEQPNAF